MLNRVKQVIAALTATITTADRKFVKSILNEAEQVLFWRMNLPDQRHALNVAYTVLELAEQAAREIDGDLLLKSALLHDVGKVKGDVSTIDKIITVMAHKVAPQWAKKWGRFGKGDKIANLRHAFYIYFHHAVRGAAMLEQLGVNSVVVELVRKHHEAPAKGDSPELHLLRKADNLN